MTNISHTQISRIQQISEATAFDQGDQFTSDEQVRDYFTVESLRSMGFDASPEQDELDRMADDVIGNRWHYEAPVTKSQAATIAKIEHLMRADGFTGRLITRPLIDELREFADGYDWTEDHLGANDGAIVVFRDSDEQHQVTGEHIVPDEGMILDRDGHEVAR